MSKYHFSIEEVKHIALATIALAFAFSLILNSDAIFGSFFIESYKLRYFTDALVAVGLAFILHELAHKFVAQKKGLWAEFRAWPMGLVMAVALAVFTKGSFVFAAPGATMISGKRSPLGYSLSHINLKDMGVIGISGPVINVILTAIALPFAAMGFQLAIVTAQVNAWLAIFNMIPFAMLDGAKVWQWSKPIWIGFFALCVGMFAITFVV
jgi:Zn-dependent protease